MYFQRQAILIILHTMQISEQKVGYSVTATKVITRKTKIFSKPSHGRPGPVGIACPFNKVKDSGICAPTSQCSVEPQSSLCPGGKHIQCCPQDKIINNNELFEPIGGHCSDFNPSNQRVRFGQCIYTTPAPAHAKHCKNNNVISHGCRGNKYMRCCIGSVYWNDNVIGSGYDEEVAAPGDQRPWEKAQVPGATAPTPAPPAKTPTSPGGPATLGPDWKSHYLGLSQRPQRRDARNKPSPRTLLIPKIGDKALHRATEDIGELKKWHGMDFVYGKMSWYGRENEPSAFNEKITINSNIKYHHCSMRWFYGPNGTLHETKQYIHDTVVLVIFHKGPNPKNPKRDPGRTVAIRVRPLSWGPHRKTKRLIDLSWSVRAAVNKGINSNSYQFFGTNSYVYVAWAKRGTGNDPYQLGIVK